MKIQTVLFGLILLLSFFFQSIALNGQSQGSQYLVAFDFIDAKNDVQTIDFRKINFAVIMVFGDMCLSCNKNVPIWNRIALLPGLYTLGLVTDVRDAVVLGYKFRTVQAVDISYFKKELNLREGIDYTLLVKKGVVVHTIYGMLTPNDYTEIKAKIAE